MTLKKAHAKFGLGLVAMLGMGYGLARVQAEGVPRSQPLWYAGSVADSAGKALETKNYDVTFGLYDRQDQQVGETASCAVVAKATRIVDGRFRIDVSECALALQRNPDLFAELAIDGGKPFARAKVGAVPFALEAEHAVGSSSADSARNGSALSAEIADLKTRVAALEGDRGGKLVGIWFANASENDAVMNSGWTDIKQSSVTFSVDLPVRVHISYGMTVQPLKVTATGFVGSRIVIDGVAASGSGSHYQPESTGADPNSVLFGQYVGELGPGSHVVKLQWMTDLDPTVTWQSWPSWQHGVGGRTLVVEAFYRQ
jgi:hypothetical protein